MLSDLCLSVLSLTLVYCGQMVGWIKVKLGTVVGLGPGHKVLDGQMGTQLLFPKRGTAPNFRPNVCCGQTAGWIKMPLGMEIELGPGDIVLDGDPAPPPHKKGHSSPHFSAHVYCGQTAGWIRMPLGMEVGLGPGHTVLVGDPASPKGAQQPLRRALRRAEHGQVVRRRRGGRASHDAASL